MVSSHFISAMKMKYFINTRGMGHYMAKKIAFIIKLPPPVFGQFMLVSFPCVTVKQMLVLVFCVLLVTLGGFIR